MRFKVIIVLILFLLGTVAYFTLLNKKPASPQLNQNKNFLSEYISPDKKISLKYPSDIFAYKLDPNIIDDSAYTQEWDNKQVDYEKNPPSNGYSVYGNDYLKLSVIFVSGGMETRNTMYDKYLSAKAGEVVFNTQYQTDYKIKNISQNGISGYIYETRYIPSMGTDVYTALWAVNGDKYEVSLTAPSLNALEQNKELFMNIVDSVKLSIK